MARDADDLALMHRTLGDLLTAHRGAAGMTQKQLGEAVGYSRVTVGTAESGHRQPAAGFWARCDDVLGASGEIARAYQQFADARARRRHDLAERNQAERSARVASSRQTSTAAVPIGPTAAYAYQASGPDGGLTTLSAAPVDEVIKYLEQQWHALVRADNLLGPIHALTAVKGQIAVIERTLRGGAGGWQARLWQLGARYAESAAWLYEDLGDQVKASGWTSRALEWAHAADDPAMVSWALFRRSQQAATARDATATMAFAQAAARDPGRLTDPMRAAIVQQHAQGLALAGDEHGALTHLDEAFGYAAPKDAAGDAAHGHGSFCTVDYLHLQRANCWMLLGRPERAVPSYRQALTGLSEAYHRDRGHTLARLGRALAATGEVEEAAACGMEAAGIGAGAGSGRIVDDVRATVHQLAGHATVPAVAALTEAVDRLGPAA